MHSFDRQFKKLLVGIVGGLVLLAGIIMIPYPGPGWLVVFAGLAILATEFTWAQRILDRTKSKYDAWQEWLKKQSAAVRAMFWLATAAIVIVTIWLLNGYGILNDLLNLGQDWLKSPLFK
jgi:uncharacterized protein (TIGR02611 family)